MVRTDAMEDEDGLQGLRGGDEACEGGRVAEIGLDGDCFLCILCAWWDGRCDNICDDESVLRVFGEESSREALADEACRSGDEYCFAFSSHCNKGTGRLGLSSVEN